MTHFTLLVLLFITGAAIGAVRAVRKGGKPFDILHHAAIYGILGSLIAAIIIVVLMRG